MRKNLLTKKILPAVFIFAGFHSFAQVQLNQLDGFGVAVYDINNNGKGIHGNGYYDFATNTSSPVEMGVGGTVAINDANQVLGNYDDGTGNFIPAYRNEGTWETFANMDSNYTYTLYDISENGIYAVGQTSNDNFESWPFIYNITTQTLTVLSSDLYEYGAAYGVNNEGIAVGWMDDFPVGTIRMPAYFDESGNITLIDENYGEASGINETGQIVGSLNGVPFVYDKNTEELQSITVPSDFISASFTDISDNGIVIGYGEMAGFSRRPIIYHPDLGEEAQSLADVLTQFGIDASSLIGTGYRISSDGNYVCGWGDGPAFMAPGWAVYFDDLLLAVSDCTLECPENIVVDAPLGSTSMVVEYEMNYSCEGEEPDGTEVVLVNGFPSGSEFPIGTTTIYHELRDGEGNVLDSCSFTITVNDAYCNSTFEFYTEPISFVGFAGIENTTSAELVTPPFNEYFLDITGTVLQGETYPITLEGNTGGEFTDYFTVFADWNQDGDFEDQGEMYPIGTLFNSTGEDGQQLTANVEIPADATIGATRMRVVKNWDSNPVDPCGTYEYGQTEDYTLIVEENMGIDDLNNSSLTYYPNPVQNELNILSKEKIKDVSVYNLAGQTVISNAKISNQKMNLQQLPSGVYVIKVEMENGSTDNFKIIKK